MPYECKIDDCHYSLHDMAIVIRKNLEHDCWLHLLDFDLELYLLQKSYLFFNA